jgi:cupin fold WbuC family metalloprotein
MTPDGIRYVDGGTIADLVTRMRASPRGRLNLNLHPQLADPIQRFINAGQPGSYVRPHRHQSDRWELVLALRGSIDAVIFDDSGKLLRRLPLRAGGDGVVEIAGGVWHSFVFVAPESVAFEVKPGPYDAPSDKAFARWAPAEGTADAAACARWLATAAIGAVWSGAT